MAKRPRKVSAKSRKRLVRLMVLVCILTAVTAAVVAVIWRTSIRHMYPRSYEAQVQAAGEEFGLPEHLIYAIIRTESGFRAEVVSPAGAVGLMQLMPPTAQEMAQRLEGEYSVDRLTEPTVNIRLGCRYFSLLMRQFNTYETALAAYNAGPNKVRKWLADPQCSPDGVRLQRIPYEETREYVRKVLKDYEMYNKIYGSAR